MMPEKLRKFWDKFVQCLIVVICVLVTIVGIRYTLAAGTRCTPAMGIPYFYLYSAIPVSFFLVTLYEIRNLLVDFTKQGTYELVKKPEEDLTGGTAVELE